MKELIAQKKFDKNGLLNYLKNLKADATNNKEWAYGDEWVDIFDSTIKEIEANEPIDEYYMKLFKVMDDNGKEVSYDISMTIG